MNSYMTVLNFLHVHVPCFTVTSCLYKFSYCRPVDRTYHRVGRLYNKGWANLLFKIKDLIHLAHKNQTCKKAAKLSFFLSFCISRVITQDCHDHLQYVRKFYLLYTLVCTIACKSVSPKFYHRFLNSFRQSLTPVFTELRHLVHHCTCKCTIYYFNALRQYCWFIVDVHCRSIC